MTASDFRDEVFMRTRYMRHHIMERHRPAGALVAHAELVHEGHIEECTVLRYQHRQQSRQHEQWQKAPAAIHRNVAGGDEPFRHGEAAASL